MVERDMVVSRQKVWLVKDPYYISESGVIAELSAQYPVTAVILDIASVSWAIANHVSIGRTLNNKPPPTKTWDIFIRLFHWSLVVGFAVAYFT
ncbi:MAG TPA: hypothetical protein EYO59_05105 [Chromatiaceae bacterium]|nr:hypothetical protein [Chromatiaceae bacterium]